MKTNNSITTERRFDMELLSIGLVEGKNNALNIVDNYNFIYDFNIKEEKKGNRVFIKIIANDDNSNKKNNDFYNIMAKLVTEVIMKYYIKDIIYKKIFIKYNDLNKDEKIEIFKIANNYINKEDIFNKEKQIIFDEVNNYIKVNNEIIIDGFVNFRLSSLNVPIELLIENSKDKYYEEKEFKEFIKVLRYFVDIQESKMELVNIVIGDNDYKLYDKDKQLIENDFFSEVINELSGDGISKDDLLISSIITIAPKTIIIHGCEKINNEEIIKILENVFVDKVIYCKGCELCKQQMPINKEK